MIDCSYRLATENDTEVLATWWRDGAVMEHAGFPYGLTIDEKKLFHRLSTQSSSNHKVYIVLAEQKPIGEMGVKIDDKVAEIGIKICEESYQNKGIGRRILRVLITDLFSNQGMTKIVLDTMIENTRAQHVYEQLGFVKVGVDEDAFVDQLGVKRTAVCYELRQKDYQLG